MIDLTSVPQTNPVDLYRVRDAIYAPDMLITGLVHLDFFSWLAEHPSTKEEICRGLEITDRPTDVMLTLFAAMGLVEERQRVFHVTSSAREHLVKGSPWFLEPYFGSLKDRPVALDLLEVLRTGKPANWGSQPTDKNKDWHKSMETEEFATQFTAAMDCRGVYLAQAIAKSMDLSGYRHLLDVAGGSGVYACSFVTHYPHLTASVLEKPPVDRIAGGAIAKRGLTGKVGVVAADMLTGPFPSDADVHLFSNVLHDWDEPVVRQLLSKSFQAMAPGGLVMVHDAFLNADKNGPLHVAEYSVLLMHASEGRCYSVAEMEQYLRDAGYQDVTYVAAAAARGVMAGKKEK